MQKIIMLSRLFHPHIGGVEGHVEKVSLELIKRGYRVEVVTGQFDEGLKLNDYYKSIKVTRIPYPALESKGIVWNWMMKRKNVFGKADIIHVHDVFWWYLPLKIMMPGKKVYVTFHGYEPGGLPKRKNKLHRKLAERMATKTVCVGDFMRGWYGQKPDRVIYGAGDAIPKLKPKGRNAVFVGRLEADTGIFAYLRALMEIKPEIYLDIYGDGPEKAEVIRIIKRNNLPAAVHGYTNKPLEKIQEARYVFTSQYLSIIQAMQTKRLVVAVYTNPLKKDYLYLHPQSKNMIIADGGKDLTEKFNSLNSIYEAEYVERAYAWAKAQTWDKVTDIYQELWHD